jgi:hypothetical protein
MGYLNTENFHMAAILLTKNSTNKYTKHCTFFENVLKYNTLEPNI